MKTPSILYKYRSWQENENISESEKFHKKILTNQEFYISSPYQFNDPFDLAIPKRLDLMTKDQFFRYTLMTLGTHPNTSNRPFKELHKFAIQKTEERFRNNIEESLQESIDHFCSTHGVFSLSESQFNILSWSFYANNHAGFCIGFDIEKLMAFLDEKLEKKVALMKVNYTDTFPSIIPDMDIHMKFENIATRLTTKFIDWSYEKEWRIIAPQKGETKLILPKNIIYSLFLGDSTTNKTESEIKQILKETYNSEVRLFKLKSSKTGYEFKIKEISY